MSFRQIIVKDSNYLSLANNNLIANLSDNEVVKVPLEDIAIIVLENNRSTLSVNLINRCSEANIVIITCNEKRLPQSIIMPFSGHYRYLENTYLQLNYTTVKKQNLWRDVIKQKISNQANVINYTTDNQERVELLSQLISDVERNDKTNREAYAAKIFFEELYGNEFKRFVDDKINAALNYGYSVLVSSVARQLVSYGLDPKLGLWHKSKSNNLNLAYDLVEPFRPIVDYYIWTNYDFVTEDLTPNVRKSLVGLLNAKVKVGKDEYRLQNAIELFIKQMMLIIRGEEEELHKVELLPVKFYEIQ